MAQRRYDEAYERDRRDRRRDPRDIQRDPEPRDRDHRRVAGRDQDSMDYSRDAYADLRTTRDPTSRPAYSYGDQNDRDDPSSRAGYLGDPRDRYRQPINLQSGRREEPSSPLNDYFLPGEDINREVIQYDICRYLGNDATVRPYIHRDGRRGYLITAYRALTTVSTVQIIEREGEVRADTRGHRRRSSRSKRTQKGSKLNKPKDDSFLVSQACHSEPQLLSMTDNARDDQMLHRQDM
jgi:hypothetical protein